MSNIGILIDDLRSSKFLQRVQFEMPLVQFSSSEIRRRVARGLSIRYQTPRAVEEYIRHHGLYRMKAEG